MWVLLLDDAICDMETAIHEIEDAAGIENTTRSLDTEELLAMIESLKQCTIEETDDDDEDEEETGMTTQKLASFLNAISLAISTADSVEDAVQMIDQIQSKLSD
jgi:hypothetical protein